MNNQVILVVEDESAICNLVTTTLEAEGYRCHVARNGKQALIEAGCAAGASEPSRST